MSSSSPDTGTLTYGKGSVLFRQDEAANRIFVIQSGHVRIERRVFQETFVLETLGSGHMIGEAAMLPDATYPSTAVAGDDVEVVAVAREALAERMQASTELAMRVSQRLAARVVQAHFRLANFALRVPMARVMLQLRAEAARREGLTGGVYIPIPYDLPEVLATERALVDRAITSLAEDGLVGLDGEGRFCIADLPGFDRLLHYLELSDRFAEPHER